MVVSASTNQVWTKITIRSYAWSFGHSDPDPSRVCEEDPNQGNPCQCNKYCWHRGLNHWPSSWEFAVLPLDHLGLTFQFLVFEKANQLWFFPIIYNYLDLSRNSITKVTLFSTPTLYCIFTQHNNAGEIPCHPTQSQMIFLRRQGKSLPSHTAMP